MDSNLALAHMHSVIPGFATITPTPTPPWLCPSCLVTHTHTPHHVPQALQRGLPRPLSLDGMPPAKPTREAEALPLTARADEALRRELQALITHDAVKYPLGGAAGGGKDK